MSGGRRPVTKQMGLDEKEKKKEGARREQEAAVVQGESDEDLVLSSEGLNNNLKNKKLEEVQSTPDAKLPRKSPSIPGSGYSENQS
ncbi:hypothetical protein WN943_015531 [Citrus x changshan-huyou]